MEEIARRDFVTAIAGQKPDVISAFVALHRRFADRGHACDRTSEWRRVYAARDIGKIGDHRRCGRRTAGAGTDQRDRRQSFGVDGHGVSHTHDLGDGGILTHHGRMHALLDAASVRTATPRSLIR